MEECSDPDRAWYPQRSVCYATMELISANARYERIHRDLPYHDGTFENWAPEQSRSHPYRFDDAVSIWVAPVDLSPDDDFLAASPSSRDDSDADEDEHEAQSAEHGQGAAPVAHRDGGRSHSDQDEAVGD